jgi:hypothetical protein
MTAVMKRCGVGVLTVLTVFLLGGCSRLIRVRIDFAVPNVGVVDPARLHVRGRVSCDSFDEALPPEPPPFGLTEAVDPNTEYRGTVAPVKFRRDGTIARAEFRAGECHLAIAAFYDTNGNSVVDAGDYVASRPATRVRDLGACRGGNMNDLGTVTLELVR